MNGSFDEYQSYTAGSYPALSSASDVLNPSILAEDRPRILLMGLKRSGKSSIQKVVFEKLSPHSTLLLDATNEIRIKGMKWKKVW